VRQKDFIHPETLLRKEKIMIHDSKPATLEWLKNDIEAQLYFLGDAQARLSI
jgi:hypothetical protein